jgi:hypothetical protein
MSLRDPYAPPRAETAGRPRVIAWYRAYAASMAMLYLTTCGVGTMMLFQIDQGIADESGRVAGVIILIVSLVLAGRYTFAAVVPLKPWAWVVGLVAIAVGLTGCTLVLALPLLLHWLKPVTKAAFGRPPL